MIKEMSITDSGPIRTPNGDKHTLKKTEGYFAEVDEIINSFIRLYCLNHPHKNKYSARSRKLYDQGQTIVFMLTDAYLTFDEVKSFDEIRNIIWEKTGFTKLQHWVENQENMNLLLLLSGKKSLFEQMRSLGKGAFYGPHAIISDSLKKTRTNVARLYGWLCLVKALLDVAGSTSGNRSLLAANNESENWEPNIVCCTLIFQAALQTDQTSFTLEDVKQFCKLCTQVDWPRSIKAKLLMIATRKKAKYVYPIICEFVDLLFERRTSIFRIADQVRLSASKERNFVKRVFELANIAVYEVMEKGEAELLAEWKMMEGIWRFKEFKGYDNDAVLYFHHLLDTRRVVF